LTLKQNTLIVAGVIVIVVGLAGGYFLGYWQLNDAADQMLKETTLVSTKLENATLIPLKGDLRLTYSVRNPTTMKIVLNMDADLYYGDVYIGHVVSNNQVIPPSARTEVVVTTKIQGDLLKAIQQGTGKTWLLKGTMTFTDSALGILPVTVTKTGDLSTMAG